MDLSGTLLCIVKSFGERSKSMEYSVVIPAYNEETRIVPTLINLLKYMDTFSQSYEVIVVNDGSDDKTQEVIERFAAEHNQVKALSIPHKGKGYAVRAGVLNSAGEFVLMADADGATPIEEIKRLSVWVQEHGFDVAIASREGIGAKRFNEPFHRHLMGRAFNLIIRTLLLPGIQDTQCGFKLFTAKAARDVFSNLVLFGDNSPTIGMPRVTAFDVELLVVAKRHGYTIKEVPVNWVYSSASKVSPIYDSVRNLIDVLRVKLLDLKKAYLPR